MGFLADVGRANVLGQVMQYGQFVRQGEALRQNEALTNQKLQRGAIDIQQKQAEYEELHRKRPSESSIIFQMTPEEQRPALLEVMKKGGYVDENGMMSAFNKNQMLNESAEFWKFYIPIQQQQAQMAVDKSLPAMLKAQSSGDAEAFEKAKNQYMQDIGKLAAAKGAIGELAKLIPGLGGDEKAPTVKEFDEGEETVTRQWSPSTQKWDEVARGPRYKPPSTTVNVSPQGKLDIETAKTVIHSMPKLQEEAVTASTGLIRLNRMTELIQAGAGGKVGQLKAALAPWAEAAGIDSASFNEAQEYELLATTLQGSFRLAMVGSGQVSDYEQRLLSKINAGGNAAIPAAKELINFYRKQGMMKINNYNKTSEALSEESPLIGRIYTPIDVGGPAEVSKVPPDLPKGTINNGDGTFTLPNGKVVRRVK